MKYKVYVNSNSGYRVYEGVESRRKEDIICDFGRMEAGEYIEVYNSKGRLVYALEYDMETKSYYRPAFVGDDGYILEYNIRTRRYE